jgi:putative intracellular protease/amidase
MSDAKQRILIAVTSHDQLGSTGKATGAYLSEVAHPVDVFRKAGYDVDFVSPRGGQPPLDGTDKPDAVSKAFLDDPAIGAKLAASQRPADVVPRGYDAIFYAGGHGTMWDFPHDEALARLAAAIYEQGGVVAAVCHGPAGLVNLKLSDGSYLVSGKEVAAFTNEEESAVGLTGVVPFLLADELASRGATHKPAGKWQAHVVTSERLVTGQNPASAGPVAKQVVEVLAAR